MTAIDIDSFVTFCQTRVGQELETTPGKSPFKLSKISEKAFYYEVSPNKVRKQAKRYIDRVLQRYAQIHSLNPGHYADITPNGTYILALVKLYEEFRNRELKNS
jgi:hypothetical protein